MALQPGFLDEKAMAEGVSLTSTPEQPALLSDEPRGPVLLEADEASIKGRVSPTWEPAIVVKRRARVTSASWLGAGIVLFLVSWIGLSAAAFTYDQFSRSRGFGFTTLVCMAASVLLILRGVAAEASAFGRLAEVERLRRDLSRADLTADQAKVLCRRWMTFLSTSISNLPDAEAGLDVLQTVPEIKSFLRVRVLNSLRQTARRAGRRASLEAGALVAITPSPALDGLFTGFRALKLVRQVAQIYGLRPSPMVTLALIRRVAWTAAGVSGIELLSQTLADHTLQSLPIIKHLAGAVPGTSAAAIRIYRLADITAEACSPLIEV